MKHDFTWTPETELKTISVPFMDMVLAERFLLPPDSLRRFQMPVPTTIQELIEATGMPLQNIYDILSECVRLNDLVWLNAQIDEFLKKEDCWIVDMRPMIDFDTDPLHPDARIFHHGNQAAQLEHMRTLKHVIILSSTPGHAWSAAMALRQMDIPAFLLR